MNTPRPSLSRFLRRPPRPAMVYTFPALAALGLLGVAGPAAAAPLPDRAWGTYLGGEHIDWVRAVAADAAGNLYVTGATCRRPASAPPAPTSRPRATLTMRS